MVVTEQLDPNLDWSSFQLGDMGFGSFTISVPPGLSSYSTRVDATATLGIYVDVAAALNPQTGLVTWTFTSIDPKTFDVPDDPLAGFLPPDTSPPNGAAFVTYTVKPKSGTASGTPINAQASVVFDTNAPLDTPAVLNTLNAGPPTSIVTALPATIHTTSFAVSWTGQDDSGGRVLPATTFTSPTTAARSASGSPPSLPLWPPTRANSATPTAFTA